MVRSQGSGGHAWKREGVWPEMTSMRQAHLLRGRRAIRARVSGRFEAYSPRIVEGWVVRELLAREEVGYGRIVEREGFTHS